MSTSTPDPRKPLIPSSAAHFGGVFGNTAVRIASAQENITAQHVLPPRVVECLTQARDLMLEAKDLVTAEGERNKATSVGARSEKKAERELANARLKAEKQARREAKKAEREAEKAAKEAKKAAEQASKAAVKATPPAPAASTSTPAAGAAA